MTTSIPELDRSDTPVVIYSDNHSDGQCFTGQQLIVGGVSVDQLKQLFTSELAKKHHLGRSSSAEGGIHFTEEVTQDVFQGKLRQYAELRSSDRNGLFCSDWGDKWDRELHRAQYHFRSGGHYWWTEDNFNHFVEMVKTVCEDDKPLRVWHIRNGGSFDTICSLYKGLQARIHQHHPNASVSFSDLVELMSKYKPSSCRLETNVSHLYKGYCQMYPTTLDECNTDANTDETNHPSKKRRLIK